MDAAVSALVDKSTTLGTVEGEKAEITYGRRSFRYRLAESKTDVQPKSIEEDRIIGLIPAGGHQPDAYALLYVDIPSNSGASNTAKPEESTVLKSITITSPPQGFLEGLSLPRWQLKSSGDGLQQWSSITVLISTLSGSNHAEAVYTNLLHPFLTHVGLTEGQDYTAIRTESTSTITDLTTSTLLPCANAGTNQTIILLSGDGGVVDVLNGLLSSGPLTSNFIKPVLAILPMGTGNALAHSTGIAGDRTLGLATLARGHPRPLPIFKTTSSTSATDSTPEIVYGAVVVSWGLHASLVADSDTPIYRAHGALRFQMAAKENLFPTDGSPAHAYRGTVSVLRTPGVGNRPAQPSEIWTSIPRTEHAYILLTLVSHLERGFVISPSSAPLSGQLRLVHFGPQPGSGADVMRIMGLAYAGGKHVDEEAVGYEAVAGLRVEFAEEEERWRRVCVDGRIVVVPRGGVLEVRREERAVLDLLCLER